jgi:hypothetical protein
VFKRKNQANLLNNLEAESLRKSKIFKSNRIKWINVHLFQDLMLNFLRPQSQRLISKISSLKLYQSKIKYKNQYYHFLYFQIIAIVKLKIIINQLHADRKVKEGIVERV